MQIPATLTEAGIKYGFYTIVVTSLTSLLVQLLHRRKEDQIKEVVEKTHALVNSGSLIQLEYIVALATRLAVSGNAADVDALKAAQRALQAHKTGQAVADMMNKGA